MGHMKQLSITENNFISDEKIKNRWKLYIDGASRGNPGFAGAGIYLIRNEKDVFKRGFFLGVKTNNQAEYFALVLGLYFAINHNEFNRLTDSLEIFADSLLLVKQIKKEYRLKATGLISLYEMAVVLLEHLNFTIHHILREYNAIADKAANQGIDGKILVPLSFEKLCKKHAVVI